MKDYPPRVDRISSRTILKGRKGDSMFLLKLLTALLLFIIAAMFFVYQRTDYIKTERTIHKLALEKRKIETSILPLKLEERYLSRLAKVERIANEKLYLYFPEQERVVKLYVDKSEHK